MRRWLCLVLVVLLTGCAGKNEPLEKGLAFREMLLASSGCSFTAEVTADYGDKVQIFTMQCTANQQGSLEFTVIAPESISGVAGHVDSDGGKLDFADMVLAFPLLAEETLSPVSAPWIMVSALREGYLTSACMEGDILRLTLNDDYDADALQLDIWLDKENRPVQADIMQEGKRILTVVVTDFQIL